MNFLFSPRYAAKLLVVVILGSSLFSTASPLPIKKKLADIFVSYEFKVAINFPGAYEETIKEATNAEGEVTRTLKVQSNISGNLYMLTATKHANVMTKSTSLAHTSLNSFVKSINGELKNQKMYSQKGSEGLDGLIYLPATGIYIYYRVIILDHFQYQLIVSDKSSDFNEAATAFMSSFKMQ